MQSAQAIESGKVDAVTIVAAALLPPLGVFRAYGPGRDFVIACAMTVAGYLPGAGFALIRVLAPRPLSNDLSPVTSMRTGPTT